MAVTRSIYNFLNLVINMAQKKGNTNLLIFGAIAAGGFYYIYKKQKDQKEAAAKEAESQAKEAEKAIQTETKPTKKSAPVPTAAERAYTEAIRKLQTALGISPTTGYVGDKTKAALRALKLSDVVTSGNVADLITKVEAAKKKSATPSKPVLSLAQQVQNAWNKSTSSKLIVTETITIKPKLEDKVRNVWNDDPGKYSRTFYKGNTIARADGYTIVGTTTSNKVVLKNKAGEFFLLDPNKFIVQ